ncbi:MAG: serine hydrolase, partial [Acidobacteria bacterium]|nr:serine hydrolase [Acidobacteriota bacterium]
MPHRLAGVAPATLVVCLFGWGDAAAQPAPADLDGVFSEWDREDSPGCAAGALRNGEFVFRGAYGMANLDHAVPLTPDSMFRMASVSKQFTVAAVLVAEDQGLLSLEDPIRKHFPDLPDWADPVRIRHLVHHTSGIRDYLVVMSLSGFGDDAHYTDADVLAALRQLERLNFEPGAEYLYSNSGYWLLAELIPRVSGMTLRQFATEHLLGPVGMKNSHFHDRHRELVPGRATGYRPRPEAEGGGFEVDATTLEMVGDGGLMTSINELAHWERMFLDPAALGPDLVGRLLEPGRFGDGSVQDYAGGLVLGSYRGLATVSHGGSWVGFRTYALRFPEQAFAVFVLCNSASADPGTLSRRVADLFLAEELATPPGVAGSASTEAPGLLPGHFWEAASGSLASVERRDSDEGSGPVLVRSGRGTPLSRGERGLSRLSGGNPVPPPLLFGSRPDRFLARPPRPGPAPLPAAESRRATAASDPETASQKRPGSSPGASVEAGPATSGGVAS